MSKSLGLKNQTTGAARITAFLCVCAACVVLTAGLWPFHAPRNNIHWLQNENGIRFDSYGTVLTDTPLTISNLNRDSFCALEIWMASGLARKGTILAVADSSGARVPFRLRQVGDNLALEREVVDRQGRLVTPWLTIENVFRKGPVLVTLSTGTEGTSVYVDGALVKTSRSFGLQRNDLAGRIILGTSTINDSWTGQITGLAIYPHGLSRDQVASHLANWQSADRTALVDAESPDALYLFNERSGNVIHNERDPATSLMIPAHYRVLHNPFLQPPWEHYRDRWSAAHFWPYWLDAAVNVAGFIPVGFVFMAYLRGVKMYRHPVVSTILIGFALSLTIEVLQAFLPTRNSGMTDLITNTAGTAAGAFLYRFVPLQRLWASAVFAAASFVGGKNQNEAYCSPERSSIPA